MAPKVPHPTPPFTVFRLEIYLNSIMKLREAPEHLCVVQIQKYEGRVLKTILENVCRECQDYFTKNFELNKSLREFGAETNYSRKIYDDNPVVVVTLDLDPEDIDSSNKPVLAKSLLQAVKARKKLQDHNTQMRDVYTTLNSIKQDIERQIEQEAKAWKRDDDDKEWRGAKRLGEKEAKGWENEDDENDWEEARASSSDPNAQITFFETMRQKGGKHWQETSEKLLEYLNTHAEEMAKYGEGALNILKIRDVAVMEGSDSSEGSWQTTSGIQHRRLPRYYRVITPDESEGGGKDIRRGPL